MHRPRDSRARSAKRPARPVVQAAFDVLNALRAVGPARISEITRRSQLPRTTVHRLLLQLESQGAVERVDARWCIGATMLYLGAEVPTAPRLRELVRRPLSELQASTRQLAGLSVATAAGSFVVDVVPGPRPLPLQPRPGVTFERTEGYPGRVTVDRLASTQAELRAAVGDPRLVIDRGENQRGLSCVAVPVPLPSGRGAAVWSMTLGDRVPGWLTEATAAAAAAIKISL